MKDGNEDDDDDDDESDAQSTIPEELNSASSKLVYLYIRLNEMPTLTEMSEELHMKKLTLYSVLETLQDNGLVDKTGDRYAHTS